MNPTYDEDISRNPFFVELQNEHPDVLRHCVEDGWILCVPRVGSLKSHIFTQCDFLSHLLIPDEELADSHFYTLAEKSVSVSNKIISVDRKDAGPPLEIHLLFEETFYTGDDIKYKVWCIEAPLNGSYVLNENTSSFICISTLRDCIDFLWTESAGKDVLENIDAAIKEYKKKNINRDNVKLNSLRDSASALYTTCLQIAFRNKRLKESAKTCQNVMTNVKLAVETYMHHGIYDELFDAISSCTAYEDSSLNKTIRNLADLQLRDLNIDEKLFQCIPAAKMCFSRIQSFSTVLGKVNCIKNAITAINRKNTSDKKKSNINNFLSTDELLPILIFLVIKSGLPNWHTHLNFIKHFRFSINSSFQLDETSYLISTLEAVIEHIKSESLTGSPLPESQWIHDTNNATSVIEIGGCQENVAVDVSRTENDSGSLEYLFKQIKLSNYDSVKEILGRYVKPDAITNENLDCAHFDDGVAMKLQKTVSIEEILHDDDSEHPLELCHPLCVCAKCCRVLSKNMLRSSATVFSCDSQGFTALHIACIYGKSQIVDLVLEMGADVNATDYNGSTSLHYASSRGHQNAVLLLLHAGADINKENMDKNTALHLAANNGHESCIKALIYFAEYCKLTLAIGKENDNGETPLHLASKWGYGNIARLLMEYGGEPWKRNVKNKSPIDVAHSSVMLKLLLSSSPYMKDYVNIVNVNENIAEVLDTNNMKSKFILLDLNEDNSTQESAQGNKANEKKITSPLIVRPQSTSGIKQIERLFSAITYGDTKLACFYMDIDSNIVNFKSKDVQSAQKELCHPLCSCKQCKTPGDFKTSSSSFNVNTCDLQGNTALHIASKYGNLELCKILLHNNADLNIQNKNGYAPIHTALQESRTTIAKLLIDSNCNLDLKDSHGNTALHLACISGNVEIVKAILNTGFHTQSKNISGRTPLDEAKEKMFLTIMALLEELLYR